MSGQGAHRLHGLRMQGAQRGQCARVDGSTRQALQGLGRTGQGVRAPMAQDRPGAAHVKSALPLVHDDLARVGLGSRRGFCNCRSGGHVAITRGTVTSTSKRFAPSTMSRSRRRSLCCTP